jgi:hypothetical protein
MGADGGTIPTRCELVKTRKKPEQKDKDSVRIYKWQFCNLTQQPLVRPIVACELGRLYNKEAIIEKLLENKSGSQENGDKLIPEAATDHIKSLKDVKELLLADNPDYDRKSKEGSSVGGAGFLDRNISPYICPVAGLEMNGRFKFVFDWSTGKVYSERALKIVNNDKSTQIAEENLVVVNPDEKSENEKTMVTKMIARRARAKALKKASKVAKRKQENNDTAESSKLSSAQLKSLPERVFSNKHYTTANGESQSKKSKHQFASQKGSNSSKFPNKLPTNNRNEIDNHPDNTKNSVQSDNTKSEVFKSLFSSHKSAENKTTGPWITFDPRYN